MHVVVRGLASSFSSNPLLAAQHLYESIQRREITLLKGLWLMFKNCHTILMIMPQATPRLEEFRLFRLLNSLQEVELIPVPRPPPPSPD